MELMGNALIAAAVAAILSATDVLGASAPFCPETGLCFRWGAPQNTIQSGFGNVYFQLQAPTEYKWLALGIGSQMRDSEMFVVYAANSDNVTLSTKQGTGHVMPEHVPRADVQLMDGSGIDQGIMTTNVRCGQCRTLDFAGPVDWIAAWSREAPPDPQNPASPIAKHDGYDIFNVDFSKVSIAQDENPFLGRGPANDNQDAVSRSGGVNQSDVQRLAMIHGIVMAIVFIVGYPVGSALMPLVGKWLLHASWQMLTFLGIWAGFGIGYSITRRMQIALEGTHIQLGISVCALMGLQPILGWLHHLYFIKHGQRGTVSHVHICYGQGLLILGIINGGLGLKMGEAPRSFVVTYSIIAAITSLTYVAAIAFRASRKHRQARPGQEMGIKSRAGSI